MGFLLAHSAWQIVQFPICWPMNGLSVHWFRSWGVLSFSERLLILIKISPKFVPKDPIDNEALTDWGMGKMPTI